MAGRCGGVLRAPVRSAPHPGDEEGTWLPDAAEPIVWPDPSPLTAWWEQVLGLGPPSTT
ncbi:hypothetical protein SIM91_43395 [Rhodococcus opacus]|uniref:hypothetical protein n=1 Tax=Rhodococcus opacus TaxID=37919 RepID=UPI00030D24BA|nr:hypothetical protein [Rhodococcus opacus]MDX5970009.1 hypothetical protein [Rhodococcus opacus]